MALLHLAPRLLARHLLAAAVFAGLVGVANAQQGARPPAAVTVMTVHARDVTLTSTLPGRIVASGVAEVRPQVAGIITERLFDEGAEVTLGDPLYRIDPASYNATAAAARAAVAQARAGLSSAQREAARQAQLRERNVSSQQNVDDAITARDVADAGVQVALAQLQSAGIDLDRTTIKAPLSGVIGLSLTTRGALVTAGQTQPLAVIRSIDTVYVDVTQSAAELIRWRRGQTEEQLGNADRTVTLTLADGAPYDQSGQLTAAEPHVDELTGVVVLRMEFPNPDRLLLPGMYVQVELPQGIVKDVVLVPQRAVGRDRRGRPTALVVTADNIVEERILDVLRDRGTDWVVRSGLQDGDRVIIEGLQKTAPGATVAPEEQAAAPAATSGN